MKQRIYGNGIQGVTGGGKSGEDYDYNYRQLHSLDLKREEHAEAMPRLVLCDLWYRTLSDWSWCQSTEFWGDSGSNPQGYGF